MASKTIGVGIIGLGMGRNALGINADRNSGLAVRAICDVEEGTVARVASEYPDEELFQTTEYREILDRPDIDVVGIYSPDHLHFKHLSDALEAGKHVICTKPLVVSLDEAKATVDLVRRTGLKFLVGQTCRFVPRFMAAKELLDSGDLGRLLFAEAHYVHDMRPVFDSTPWRHTAPQDLMYGGSCHPIDLLRWIAGDVEEVFCYGSASGMDPRYPEGKMDNFFINLKFKNGVLGRVMAVFGLVEPPLPMNGLSIFGTGGSFVEDTAVFDRFVGQPEWNLEFKPEPGHGNEVLRYMRHFEECLVEDTTPSVNEVEGAKCIAVCSAAWESLASGQPAKVFNDF
ncbi:MAG: Gfo/Idh/MocA family oxidoreductase [Chloroflexota bacterium]|jgi:predicted dehydrogenase|nr:Gfo/Idh/MocA family oxidoreductase [Chloroflexota bacterium]